MKIGTLRTADEDLEIIILYDGGKKGGTIDEFKEANGKLYCSIDKDADMDKSIEIYEYNEARWKRTQEQADREMPQK